MKMNFELKDKLYFKFFNKKENGNLDPVGNIYKQDDDCIKDIKIMKCYNFYMTTIIDKNHDRIATFISDVIHVYDNLEKEHLVVSYE